MYVLQLSPTIVHEWMARCIGDVIPALGDQIFKAGQTVAVDRATLDEIAADCAFMSDPKAVDCSPGERRAYRAMLAQCRRAVAAALPPQSVKHA